VVDRPNRVAAFLAYLLPIVGWLFVLLFQRKDRFAAYHACQSLGLQLMLVVMPVGWAVIAWSIAWVPLAGPVLAAALFALVIAAYIAGFVAWVAGMINALNAKIRPVPVFGGWGERAYSQLAA
jgi:uncharacterized membrane protein